MGTSEPLEQQNCIRERTLFCIQDKCQLTAVKRNDKWQWSYNPLRRMLIEKGGIPNTQMSPYCPNHGKCTAA